MRSPYPRATLLLDFGAWEVLLIAVVGMSVRFPGAPDVEAFWRNLREGRESITFFSEEELLAAGAGRDVLSDPAYVRAGAILGDVHGFDASFFDISPVEARIMDPQHRLFMECAWEALEHAGTNPGSFDGRIGVYGGCGLNTYLLFNLLGHAGLIRSIGMTQLTVGSDKDHLPARVSYKLNLRGPSVSVQTACSTSLVAVHLACESLLSGECDMALAGGVNIVVPQTAGYRCEPDGLFSPDGHCRAFDARAGGTVPGSGAGVVVLKRLEDALADRDHVHAVIRGSAVNNDGAARTGYAAPSRDGQSAVIAAAQALAAVEPSSIGYVEAHGTATHTGDAVEFAALNRVFGEHGACALGSVKTNIGHTVAAAGVAGLVKAVLCVEHGLLVPSLHFEEPNPRIDFARGPFRVSTTLLPWPEASTPRRAGVSSFGLGGTNAHVVVEQAPPPPPPPAVRPWPLLVLSARSAGALETMTANLTAHLDRHPELDAADVAYTLQVGRQAFGHRRALVCRDRGDAFDVLERRDPGRLWTGHPADGEPPVVFLFPGLDAPYVGMAQDLYQTEATFREHLDQVAWLLGPHLGMDVRDVLHPHRADREEAGRQLERMALAQPALFAVEHALARLWMSWGIRPRAVLGYGLGEYVAAVLSGVLSLEEAVTLVAIRGRLLDRSPEGAMLGVSLAVGEVEPLLEGDLAVAAVDGSSHCTVAGPPAAVEALRARLREMDVESRLLHVTRAAHSPMVDPLIAPFTAEVRRMHLHAPEIPFVSGVTGTWITGAEARDPAYWGRHLRQPVRFGAGVRTVATMGPSILLEVGPGVTLRMLARRELGSDRERLVLASGKHPADQRSDQAALREALGELWVAGCDVDWAAVHSEASPGRVGLPAYPFERRAYWIDPGEAGDWEAEPAADPGAAAVEPGPDVRPATAEVTGLSPGQHRIVARPRPEHCCRAAVYEVPATLDLAALELAFGHVLRHHDGLRAGFERAEDGWRQVIPPPSDGFAISLVDLSALDAGSQAAEILAHGIRAQELGDVAHGPLLRVVHFDLGGPRRGRLLVAAARLVCDGFSTAIVKADVQTAYRQIARGERVALPAPTTSLREYLDWQASFARSPGAEEDLDYWLGLPWDRAGRLPVDLPDGWDRHTLDSEREVAAELTADETTALYRHVLPAAGAEVGDVLLAGLAQTVAAWAGTAAVNVALHDDRRESVEPSLDLSRTVGCLGFAHPELLVGGPGLTPAAAVAAIRGQRLRLPRRGYTFEVLRTLGRPQVRELLGALPDPQITFRYVSCPPVASSQTALLRPAAEDPGPGVDPRLPREPLLRWQAVLMDDRVRLRIGYSESLHREATARALVDGHAAWLRSLIEHYG